MGRHLSIRDLQKISGEAIERLPGTTAITSGGRTIALLLPLRRANMTRLRETLAKAEDMAKGRDVAADDLALSAFGEVDPVNWSYEAVEALKRERS